MKRVNFQAISRSFLATFSSVEEGKVHAETAPIVVGIVNVH